jgi:hypothetical protein
LQVRDFSKVLKLWKGFPIVVESLHYSSSLPKKSEWICGWGFLWQSALLILNVFYFAKVVGQRQDTNHGGEKGSSISKIYERGSVFEEILNCVTLES